MKAFQFIIISSPSGAGKTTLSQMLVRDDDLGSYRFSVSHTTRTPREGEKDGAHYYFTDLTRFRRMIKNGEFAEHARVHGNYYGTSLEEIRRRQAEGGDGIIFDIDYQGAGQIKKKIPEALSVFILPPSIHELRRRLKKRGTEKRKDLEIRLRNAIKEIKNYGIFDYIVINDNLADAYKSLATIIKADRFSRPHMAHVVNDLLLEWKRGTKR